MNSAHITQRVDSFREIPLIRTRLNNAGGLTVEQISKAQLCETELPDYIDLDPNYHGGALKERYPWAFE